MKTSDGISQKQYDNLGSKIKELLVDYAKTLQNDSELEQYLDNDPFPELSNVERTYYLLLNRLKNWVAKEQGKKDGGSYWKKQFKVKPTGNCQVCDREFRENDEIEFHHTLRDGRKPIPLHKECHTSLHSEK
ncbi:MAG: hypothetical protein ACL93V_05965 [Candidatus Electrothrix sp. YB6]